jgi:type 1 glutamine amidotransferase
MRALVICDDHWHPASLVREGLAGINDGEFVFDWVEDAADWSPERMTACPLVILARSNRSAAEETGWMTDGVQAAFADYVRSGNGLLAIHSGTADYENALVLRSILGGVFSHHPEQCPVTVEPHPGHPLAAGSHPFTVQDEHYFMEMDDQSVDLFVTTRSEHGEQPSFQALLRNALRWCGGTL